MQHRQEDRPLDIEFESASFKRSAYDLPDTALLPEPLEDQLGADLTNGNRLGLSRRASINDPNLFTVTQPRAKKPVKLAADLKNIQAPEGGNDLLAYLPTFILL